MTATEKLTLRRHSFLTNGTILVEVIGITKELVTVEDVRDEHRFAMQHEEFASGDWRSVEPEDLPPPRVKDREFQRMIDEVWCG